MMDNLKKTDPAVFGSIVSEARRQADGLELIASENFVSQAVLEAMGTVMTNKYAEGLPSKRYYGGCEFVDVAERLAIERAKELLEKNPSIATALNPYIGYDAASVVAKEAAKRGVSVRQVVAEKELLPDDEIDDALDVRGMTEPGLPS